MGRKNPEICNGEPQVLRCMCCNEPGYVLIGKIEEISAKAHLTSRVWTYLEERYCYCVRKRMELFRTDIAARKRHPASINDFHDMYLHL